MWKRRKRRSPEQIVSWLRDADAMLNALQNISAELGRLKCGRVLTTYLA